MMARTIGSKIATRLGKVVNSNTITNRGKIPSPVDVYSDINNVPLSNNDIGDLAYVDSPDNRLYLWNGNGWRSVGLGILESD